MIFRAARPEEHPKLLRLLSSTDCRWNADRLFEDVSLPHNTFICEVDDEVLAILYLFPASIAGSPGFFMQPMSVEPSFLLSGVASELIEYAKHILSSRGARFIATTTPTKGTPAESWLAITDFKSCTTLRQTEFVVNNLSVLDVEFIPVEAEHLTALRARYVKGSYLTFSDAIYKAYCGYWQRKNAVIAVMQNGYGVFHSTPNGIIFRELFSEDIYNVAALMSVVGRMEGCERVKVHTALDYPLFSDDTLSTTFKYGSICLLDKGFDCDEVYMSMMFD